MFSEDIIIILEQRTYLTQSLSNKLASGTRQLKLVACRAKVCRSRYRLDQERHTTEQTQPRGQQKHFISHKEMF